MKCEPFVISLIVGLVAALAGGEGCGGSNRRPMSPSGPTRPPRPNGPAYTISGVISEYRGGPASSVNVALLECDVSWGITCETQTDQQGHYSLSSPGAAPTGLAVWKKGYQSAWKYNVSGEDSTVNFVLHPSVIVNTSGATVAGTIRGDEFMAGDDVLFGGLCAHTACKVMAFAEFIGAPREFEVRLRWTDSTRQLALYHFKGDPDSLSLDQLAERYCCSAELAATLEVSGYFDAIAVAFEQAGGGPPGPADAQSFELTARALR